MVLLLLLLPLLLWLLLLLVLLAWRDLWNCLYSSNLFHYRYRKRFGRFSEAPELNNSRNIPHEPLEAGRCPRDGRSINCSHKQTSAWDKLPMVARLTCGCGAQARLPKGVYVVRSPNVKPWHKDEITDIKLPYVPFFVERKGQLDLV